LLPAHGDPASPDADRFVDSIAFAVNPTAPGAIELETPKLE
jgi:hypothetical protein